MTLTVIQDTMTASLKLDLDKKTSSRILVGPEKMQGMFEDVSWNMVVGDSSDKRRTQTYHVYLRRKKWFTEIIYTLCTADPNKPYIMIKSNPTEIDIKQYATKAAINDEAIYKNPIMVLDRIFSGKLFTPVEKTRIDNLDLEISDVEVAVPLVTSLSKNGLLRMLGTIYNTHITLNDRVISVAKSLDIRCTVHANPNPNEYGNITLAVFNGRHHYFSVTFYDKISQMLTVNRKIEIEDREVWEKYLRMDIRMSRKFLVSYLGENHNLRDWVKTAQNGEFKKLLNRVLHSRLRLNDVLIPESEFESLDYHVKKLSPEFHKLWRKSTILTTAMVDASGVGGAYRKLCNEFKVRATTGGDLLAVACRTSLFQNVKAQDFLNGKKSLIAALEKNHNARHLDEIKLHFYQDLAKMCN